jgi:hypothetical protein
MTPRRLLPAAAVALTVALGALVGAPGAQYPVFDAHIHYSQPDWTVHSPEEALAILARAGVKRALVSSTPDDGTLRLYEKAPHVVVPSLRPYRTRGDMGSWTRDAEVQAYVEERLKRGIYRAIGEVHFGAGDVTAPVVKRFAELAAQQSLYFWCHIDDVAAERVLATYPKTPLLWAHAGMSASARRVGELLDRFPMLWVELALRTDVAPGGTLDPEWRAVFLRHPGRFLVGTDTWVTSRWSALDEYHRGVQGWLAQLPREVAEKIAWRNAERMFPPRPS